MLWRGKSGRMADGERADVTSTARAAQSVSLRARALFSASLPTLAMSCSAHSEPMSTQQRASADCARPAIGDLSSAFAETPQQQRKTIEILQVAKQILSESKHSHVTAPAWIPGNSAKNKRMR